MAVLCRQISCIYSASLKSVVALSEDPNFIKAVYCKAEALYEMGEFELAVSHQENVAFQINKYQAMDYLTPMSLQNLASPIS